MIQHTIERQRYQFTCDKCGRQSVTVGAETEERAKEMAGRLGWALETDCGDLCQRCKKTWHAGSLDELSEQWCKGISICARCGASLSMTATVNDDGVYLCSECARA